MLMSIVKDDDNYFIVTEEELRNMFYASINEALELLDRSKAQTQMSMIPGLLPPKSILSLEQKEFIINKAITQEMKKMQMEVE